MIEFVSFHEEAELEMNEAARFYNERVFGLGETFINEVERCTNLIQNDPEIGKPILKNIRSKILMRFPYSIMYSVIDNSLIRILAVANHKRRPFYWHNRK